MTAILFDLDGTLTDSGPGIINSITYALAQVGAPARSAESLRWFLGPPLHESFAAIGVDPAAAIAKYREYFTATGMYENSVYDGIAEVLDGVAAAGFRLAVATSKPTVFAVRILEHFGLAGRFELVLGAELDGSRSRKAAVIADVLQTLDTPAGAAVMIGDRAADVIGAAACGVAFVGAGWGYAEPGELESAGASTVAGAPADLLRLLPAITPRRPPE